MNSIALPVIRSTLFAQYPHVRLAQSTRQGEIPDAPFGFNLGYGIGDEDARVTGNIARFAATVQIEAEDLAFMKQVHGDTIREVSEAGILEETDAMITKQPDIGLTVRTADCVPVMLYSPTAGVIAAVHAGWRGSAAHITRKTVERLLTEYNADPETLIAYLGAAAAECCYEVGGEVAALFPERWVRRDDEGHMFLDLHGVNHAQLLDAGLKADNIDASDYCTIHDHHIFHSYRRDAETSGRMLTTLVLREDGV
jgi:polyphenol oxidase